MSDVKALPENLEQLEQLTEFKRVYKKYTVDQLEDLLTEAEVDYLSADNKSELTWRLLDHRNFDFEAALAEANGEQSEPQPEPQDAPADEADEQPAPQDEPTDTPADEAEPAPQDAPADEADEAASRPQRINPRERQQRMFRALNAAPAGTAEADHVAVFNTGSFPFFETATGTLVPAKKTTKIYPTASADKGQILRNVKQYNHTRGNKLRVNN
ncbi:hypothetical protein ACTXGL_09755 [Psychrobacter sp. T6-6]|uniref:hypothetical protein n=1 Tax=Psychrobacter sp. T6-6 TaxID=3457452 RepID=UPI003FD222D5